MIIKPFKLLVLLTFSLWAEELNTYENNRFRFTIKYPSELFDKKESDFGNFGTTLVNKSKDIELALSGDYTDNRYVDIGGYYKNIKEIYTAYQEDYIKDKELELTYKVQKKNWFVFSGFKDNNETIFYQKVFYSSSKEVLAKYTFSYPATETKKYAHLIKILNKTFKFVK
jgi:hypothetical protein